MYHWHIHKLSWWNYIKNTIWFSIFSFFLNPQQASRRYWLTFFILKILFSWITSTVYQTNVTHFTSYSKLDAKEKEVCFKLQSILNNGLTVLSLCSETKPVSCAVKHVEGIKQLTIISLFLSYLFNKLQFLAYYRILKLRYKINLHFNFTF